MNREELLAAMQAAAKVKPTPVTVPRWGVVHVRPRTVEEVDAGVDREAKAQEEDAGKSRHWRMARAAAHVLCDEKGNRLLDALSDADVEQLARQPYYILRKVLNAAGGEDEDEGKPGAGNS